VRLRGNDISQNFLNSYIKTPFELTFSIAQLFIMGGGEALSPINRDKMALSLKGI
jgi:hypothetical protein